jgi:hypothetical protein
MEHGRATSASRRRVVTRACGDEPPEVAPRRADVLRSPLARNSAQSRHLARIARSPPRDGFIRCCWSRRGFEPRLVRRPSSRCGIGGICLRICIEKNKALKLLTKTGVVNRSGEYGPSVSQFRPSGPTRSQQVVGYNPRKQPKFPSSSGSGECSCIRGLAGQNELGSNLLFWMPPTFARNF